MRRGAIIAGVALVALLVAAQLVLPGIAENRVRSELKRNGAVERVEVHAFPAIKLLWHRADRVTVHMSRSAAGPGRLADLLARTHEADRLDARVDVADVGPLVLRDVRLEKRGDRLTGQAALTESDLRAALPPGLDVRPVAAGGGELVFQGSASLFGASLSAQAVARAVDGALVVTPDVPFGGLLTLTVFRDPRVAVESLDAQSRADGYTLTARARLTGKR